MAHRGWLESNQKYWVSNTLLQAEMIHYQNSWKKRRNLHKTNMLKFDTICLLKHQIDKNNFTILFIQGSVVYRSLFYCFQLTAWAPFPFLEAIHQHSTSSINHSGQWQNPRLPEYPQSRTHNEKKSNLI